MGLKQEYSGCTNKLGSWLANSKLWSGPITVVMIKFLYWTCFLASWRAVAGSYPDVWKPIHHSFSRSQSPAYSITQLSKVIQLSKYLGSFCCLNTYLADLWSFLLFAMWNNLSLYGWSDISLLLGVNEQFN